MRVDARLPLALLGVLVPILIVTAIHPPSGHMDWLLEVGPGLIGIAVLAATFRRFPMSPMIYPLVFVHVLVLIYGGYYTYADTPLGNWARDTFHLSRNHYDRIGHFALGFFPAFIIREVLLRRTRLERGAWLSFIVVSIALAIGAFYELIEWWTALIVAPDLGEKFLGSQGDVWDTQWDMLFDLIGAVVAMAFFQRVHDRSMTKAGLAIPR